MSFSKQRSRSNAFSAMTSQPAIKREDSKEEASPKPPPPAIAQDTEPFPDFSAPTEARNSDDAHCKLHCRHEACKDVYQQRAPFPRCTCAGARPTQQLQPPIGPPFEISVALLREATHLHETFPPDGKITLHQQDALAIFHKLKHATPRFRLPDLSEELSNRNDPWMLDSAATDVYEYLFLSLSKYLHTSLSAYPHGRQITHRELWIEVFGYLAIGYLEWLEEHCPEELDGFVDRVGPITALAVSKREGICEMVWGIWEEFVEHLVELLVWRYVRHWSVQESSAGVDEGLGADDDCEIKGASVEYTHAEQHRGQQIGGNSPSA